MLSLPLKSDTLAIPVLLSASSALLLLVHFISTRKIVKKLFKTEDGEELEPTVEEVPRGFVAKLRHHAKRYGGATIFIYRVLRLLAALGLVGFAVTTLVLSEGPPRTADRAQFLNWSLLGAYVRVPSLPIAEKSSPPHSSTHLSWPWPPYRHPQKLPMLQTPTSSGFCLALGLFTAIGTSTPSEPLLFSLSISTRVGSCGRSSRSSPLPPQLFQRSFQLNIFHSIPRFALAQLLDT